MLSLPDLLIKSEDKFDPPVKPEDAIHRKKSSGFPLEFTPYLIRGGNDTQQKLMLQNTSSIAKPDRVRILC